MRFTRQINFSITVSLTFTPRDRFAVDFDGRALSILLAGMGEATDYGWSVLSKDTPHASTIDVTLTFC